MLYYPQPTIPFANNTVTDTMKIYRFYDQLGDSQRLYLYDDVIYLYIHCSNNYLQQTRDKFNTDSSTALKHLGTFFQHTHYQYSLGSDPFQAFLSTLICQYNDHT